MTIDRRRAGPASGVYRLSTVVPFFAALLVAGCSVKPEAITGQVAALDAATARRDIFAGQEPITAPLTLEAALARALRYNLDHRVGMIEQATQVSQLNLLHYEMLPRLTANAGYFQRDRELVSSSRSFRTGRISEDQTIAVDRQRGIADLTLSWNLLDFGTSYYQAKQQADRVLIANERRRRAVNNIFQEVTAAYWLAATAQRLKPRIDVMLAEANGALATSQRLERSRELRLHEALRYQRDLLDLVRQLEAVAEDMQLSQSRLAQLMGLPPATVYAIAPPQDGFATPRVARSAEALERVALVNRPELQEERYNIRVAQLETRRALLRYLPNFNPFAMVASDTNSYLNYNNWAEIGVRASTQLLSLSAIPTTKELGARQVELAEMRRLAVSMAVVAQVHVSLQQISRARRQFESARQIDAIERRLNELSGARSAADAASPLDRIRTEISALSAELLRDRAYADLMNAHAALNVALGLDPLPGDVSGEALDVVAARIRDIQRNWFEGEIDVPDLPELPLPATSNAPAGAADDHAAVPR